jgi:hypothetical protein
VGTQAYNSRQRMTFSKRRLTLVVALFCASLAHAVTNWDQPSADFARQIVAITGPGTIALTIKDRSVLPLDELPAIRRALERELRTHGVIVRPATEAASIVRVSLSQNSRGWLWVAEVQQGSETRVAMLPLPGATATAPQPSGPSLTLRKTLLRAQADQILDAAMVSSAGEQRMIVLDPLHITVYSLVAGEWRPAVAYDITHSRPFPRDLRGHLVLGPEQQFTAYLPGVTCRGSSGSSGSAMTVACLDNDDPWPIGTQRAFYNSTRDYFTGVVVPGFGPKLPPFYSAAELVRTEGTAFLFADINGQVHLFAGGSHKMLTGARDWGSDIAAVRSGCGSGTQVMASLAGTPATDSVRAYEIVGREANATSAPLNFDGPVTAMWTAGDDSSAIVVAQNSQLSRSEAYRVSVDCNNR